jgi:hypothetical protein
VQVLLSAGHNFILRHLPCTRLVQPHCLHVYTDHLQANDEGYLAHETARLRLGDGHRGIFCSLTLDDIGILTLPAVVTLTLPNRWWHQLKPGPSQEECMPRSRWLPRCVYASSGPLVPAVLGDP